jgi:O-antigen ligase
LRDRTPRWLLYLMTAVVALLWVSAFFVFRGIHSAPVESPAGPISFCPHTASGEAWSPFLGSVGVNLRSSELQEPVLNRALDLLAANGVGWVRFTLPWDLLEPSPGSFDWAWSDQIFQSLAQHPGLVPLVVLDRSPAWARAESDYENEFAPPHERQDFGAFAGEVARRYGSQLRYYQVWNEPNIAPHWGARPVDPADYLGLLREAATQIRSADPDAEIVLAGLAPTVEQGGANLSDLAYLDALYNLSARQWFDAVAAQPFGFSQVAAAAPAADSLNFARVSLLRDVMNRHGDFCTPLWATSFGWNSAAGGDEGSLSLWGQVTEAEQADYLRDAAEIARLQAAQIGPLFWAAFCPSGVDDVSWKGFSLCAEGSDLLAGSFEPGPAWSALVEADTAPAILPPGDHPVNHPALHYQGNWRVTPQASDPARDSASGLWLDFYGTDLGLRVQGGPYWAFYRVWVDDAPANALPKDESGISYLVLHDPLSEIRSIPVATGLALGQHRMRLEAVGGWGQWPLQGIYVGNFASAAPWPAWLLLAAAMLGTALWTGLLRAQLPRLTARVSVDGAPVAEVPELHPGLSTAANVLQGGWLWVVGAGLVLLLFLSPWLIIDLLAIAVLGLLFVIRPDLSLPLIAASIPFWPRPEHLLHWQFSLYEILVSLAAVALVARWTLRFVLERVRRPASRPGWGRLYAGAAASLGVTAPASGTPRRMPRVRGLDWPVLALLAVGFLAVLFAQRTDVAMGEFRTVFLGGALFYWLITRVPVPAARRRGAFSPWPVLNGLVVGAVIVSIVAIWQLVSGQGRVAVEGVWRVRAFYGSPNNLALLLDRVIPVVLAIAAFGGRFGGPAVGSVRWGRRIRWFYGLAALIMVVACAATFSKGALLLGLPVGVGLVLILGAWKTRRRWPLVLLGCLAVLGIAAFAWLARTPRFAGLLNFTAGTSFFRLKLWQGALHMALDHPWLGVGPDNFLYAYRTRYVLPSAWQELNLSHPHNIVLDLWTRLGVPGLIVGAWAIWAGARRAWRLVREADDVIWPIALGLLAGLAATVAHGMIDNSLFLVDLMAVFMLSLGLLQRLTLRD